MLPGDVFVVVEALDRLFLRVVSGAKHEARPGQGDVAGVFAFTKSAPLGMPRAGEEVFYFLEVRQLLEAVQIEEFGGRCSKKRGMGHGANGGHVT
ncbi:hypothetical protein D3C80_692760 [compost metagenome]